MPSEQSTGSRFPYGAQDQIDGVCKPCTWTQPGTRDRTAAATRYREQEFLIPVQNLETLYPAGPSKLPIRN